MSSTYFNEVWHQSQHECELLSTIDYERQHQDVETTVATMNAAVGSVAADADAKALLQSSLYEFYLRYICLCNRLEDVYDNMIQPQKRQLVRKLLDACLGRVIELKHDLVNIDLMEFSYNDAVVDRLRLTPMETELRVPRYFLRERQQELEFRKRTMQEILVKLGWLEEHELEETVATEIEAIRMLQMHERARQGRLRAHFMKEIRILKEKGKSEERTEKERSDSGLLAAMKIQKMWRGHTARRITRRRKMEEMILIGMLPPPAAVLKERAEKLEKLQRNEKRHEAQVVYAEQFETRQRLVQEEIRQKHGASMKEDIADEIRAWVKDCYEKTGKLPDFPTEDQGGSLHIFSRPGTESEHSRSSARSSKESRKTKDKSKSPARSGDLNVNENQEEDVSFQPAPSICLPDIRTEIDLFNDTWRDKDEAGVLSQAAYEDMIYSDKYQEVELEFRRAVDDVMRQEIELLQTAVGKKLKKSSKKTRRSGKKNKKKKEKDLTPDRTTESLYEELVTNGIIRKYPELKLKQFLGDKALTARNGTNPSPGDIRQILTEYCILPLGSDAIHNCTPLIRSILLAGPRGSGKKALLHAICTEVGAVLFDLTPANIVGKYPGKSGLIMLIHLVVKVSRLLQPAVIYMGDAERPFMKKIPKTDRTDPKRLKKDLPKLIKNIAPEDRVIFVGTSNLPWEADQKMLQSVYNRFIYIPRPDYGAMSHAWKTLLHDYSGGVSSLDTSAMAKISDGYTIGAIDACLKEVMTCKRKLQLRTQPLTNAELINVLCTRDPVYREEEEAFESWWSKTPLGRRRQRFLELEEERLIEEQAQAAKQGNGNKKKGIN
ncbi:dynein regulatory complex protein 11 [Drosophila subobscura]|uniref:dynein regulatory complex protein 11 n=1 Tax=Drosophila subobscura TaxID=7241 RepID=UPI00155A5D79|nr:dynein regulatory complex protein 11 [Drosophila subobscura]